MLRPSLILAGVLACAPAWSAGWRDTFIDPEDGKLDLSNYLLDHRGVLPIPIVITEPAVGYGGGAALMWFSESLRDAAAKARPGARPVPPNIYGFAAFGTENGTKGGGVGGLFHFKEDTVRYRGGVAAVSANLDFYGVGGDGPKIGYNLKGIAMLHEATWRIGNSDFLVGPRFAFFDLKSSLQAGEGGLEPREIAHRSSELGFTAGWDTRDNIFFTKKGVEASIDAMFASPGIGSDNTFQTYRGHFFGFSPVAERFVAAFRADGRAARGDVPFYQLPFIDMRGIPAARYQDESTAVIEAEGRFYLTPRWVLIAFAGAARAWGRHTAFQDAGTVVGKGVGFRYLAARRLGIAVGIDVARGPEDTAWYIQMGNAWR